MQRPTKHVSVLLVTVFAVALGGASFAWACTANPVMTINPEAGPPGSPATVTLNAYGQPGEVELLWNGSGVPLTTVNAPARENIDVTVRIPQSVPGHNVIVARSFGSDGNVAWQIAAPFEVTTPASAKSPTDPSADGTTGDASGGTGDEVLLPTGPPDNRETVEVAPPEDPGDTSIPAVQPTLGQPPTLARQPVGSQPTGSESARGTNSGGGIQSGNGGQPPRAGAGSATGGGGPTAGDSGAAAGAPPSDGNPPPPSAGANPASVTSDLWSGLSSDGAPSLVSGSVSTTPGGSGTTLGVGLLALALAGGLGGLSATSVRRRRRLVHAQTVR